MINKDGYRAVCTAMLLGLLTEILHGALFYLTYHREAARSGMAGDFISYLGSIVSILHLPSIFLGALFVGEKNQHFQFWVSMGITLITQFIIWSIVWYVVLKVIRKFKGPLVA